jgi:hypothetical protein
MKTSRGLLTRGRLLRERATLFGATGRVRGIFAPVRINVSCMKLYLTTFGRPVISHSSFVSPRAHPIYLVTHVAPPGREATVLDLKNTRNPKEDHRPLTADSLQDHEVKHPNLKRGIQDFDVVSISSIATSAISAKSTAHSRARFAERKVLCFTRTFYLPSSCSDVLMNIMPEI